MSISVIKKYRAAYLGSAAFCLVFSLIYGQFSHEVSSVFMSFAFCIPLFCGAANELVLRLVQPRAEEGRWFSAMLAGAAIWLTLGSIFEGVLEIYGTTNHLIWVFPAAGLLQAAAAMPALLTGRAG